MMRQRGRRNVLLFEDQPTGQLALATADLLQDLYTPGLRERPPDAGQLALAQFHGLGCCHPCNLRRPRAQARASRYSSRLKELTDSSWARGHLGDAESLRIQSDS